MTTFTNIGSRYTFVLPLTSRTQVLECLQKAVKYGLKQTGNYPRIIYADNASDYIVIAMKKRINTVGGAIQTTIAHKKEENRIAERVNLTIMDVVRTVLYTATMDDTYCPYNECCASLNQIQLTYSTKGQ